MILPAWAVALIIVLVLAVILGNILIVRDTAHIKMPDLLGKQAQQRQASDSVTKKPATEKKDNNL